MVPSRKTSRCQMEFVFVWFYETECGHQLASLSRAVDLRVKADLSDLPETTDSYHTVSATLIEDGWML